MALSRRTNPPNGEALIYLALPLWPIQNCRTKLSVRQSGESFFRGYSVGGGGLQKWTGIRFVVRFVQVLRDSEKLLSSNKMLLLAPF